MKAKITAKAAIALVSIAIAIAFVFSAVLLTPMAALANEYQDEIRIQLLGAARAFDNYSLAYDPYIDTMDSDRSEYLTVNLRRGTSYTLVGVCDEDCQDLDLRLYDENGNLMSSDNDTDDYPVVSVTPSWSGQFKVKATMYDCSTSYCYYGVGVFSR